MDMGLDVSINNGTECTVLGLIGDTSRIDPDTLMMNIHVDRVMRIAEPFKKASRKFHPEPSVIDIGGVKIGAPGSFTVIAGPCSVESEQQNNRGCKKRKAQRCKGIARRCFQAENLPLLLSGT